jgi:hypothetical protein
MSEHRHALRKRAPHTIEVTDTMTGKTIGHVGNLSVEGMLLISHQALPPNALYQFSFNLPAVKGADSRRIEIGVHEQWSESASAPGQFWSGFRIIDIAPEDQQLLTQWVNPPNS